MFLPRFTDKLIDLKLGSGKKGARCFRNVAELDDKNVVCLANKAFIAFKTNDYDEVINWEKTVFLKILLRRNLVIR